MPQTALLSGGRPPSHSLNDPDNNATWLFSVRLQIGSGEGVRGFYRGFGFVLAGDIPGNMAYFGGYELGKAVVPSDSGVLGSMATGAIAQLIAGVVFTPIDIIKERMQVQVSGLRLPMII